MNTSPVSTTTPEKVPRLLPRLTPAPPTFPPGRFSSERYLHHREYNACMGAIAIYAALAALLAVSETVATHHSNPESCLCTSVIRPFFSS